MKVSLAQVQTHLNSIRLSSTTNGSPKKSTSTHPTGNSLGLQVNLEAAAKLMGK
jgi:hypothetical protein